MASSLAAIVGALYFGPKKCLVLDLDNTLWGGVIGDDGVDNIKLGRETPEAEAFIAFQEYCLSLRDRGVLLAVCSKNDHDVAMQGLRHQDAVLKPEHFSAIRANWLPKHENINSIAEELNLGVDSFVFVDDNPAERALVAAQLPSVAVPDVGSDVTFFARIVDRARYFESVALSAEDLARASQYRSNSERTAVAATFANYGEYLASLEMVAEIDAFRATYLDRITQLTNKTNQFNLTTRRYTAVEIEGMASDCWADGRVHRAHRIVAHELSRIEARDGIGDAGRARGDGGAARCRDPARALYSKREEHDGGGSLPPPRICAAP
jgi:FkbH-like protein